MENAATDVAAAEAAENSRAADGVPDVRVGRYLRVLRLLAADRDGREEAQEAQGGGENWGPGQT